jgi:hypothetical protein
MAQKVIPLWSNLLQICRMSAIVDGRLLPTQQPLPQRQPARQWQAIATVLRVALRSFSDTIKRK